MGDKNMTAAGPGATVANCCTYREMDVVGPSQAVDGDSVFPGPVDCTVPEQRGAQPLAIMPTLFLFLFRVVLALWLLTGPWDGQS
jgi:hypothetical protein